MVQKVWQIEELLSRGRGARGVFYIAFQTATPSAVGEMQGARSARQQVW